MTGYSRIYHEYTPNIPLEYIFVEYTREYTEKKMNILATYEYTQNMLNIPENILMNIYSYNILRIYLEIYLILWYI